MANISLKLKYEKELKTGAKLNEQRQTGPGGNASPISLPKEP